MTTQMVLFAIGPDRPGLVSKISSIIHQNDGNFEDSRMVTLAGDFALIVLFSATADNILKIESACHKLETELPLTCHFRQSSQKPESIGTTIVQFEATGHDRPGIVSRLSTEMANHGVSVVSMDTSVVNMAFIGTPMFLIKGTLNIPQTLDQSILRDSLEDVCEDLELVLEFTAQP